MNTMPARALAGRPGGRRGVFAGLLTSALAGTLALGVWVGCTAPAVETPALPPGLVDAGSTEGRRLLHAAAVASARTGLDQLAPHFVAQSRRGFCGVASAVMVVNALLQPRPAVTQAGFFGWSLEGLRANLAVTSGGMTLEELASFLRARGLQVQVVHAERSNAAAKAFRLAASAALRDPRRVVLVNYDRRALGQQGAGHISPLGAYDPASDRLLVLDVAAHRYPPTWVGLGALWAAMATIDGDSGKMRGYLLVRRD
jgi:hypothetical protein